MRQVIVVLVALALGVSSFMLAADEARPVEVTGWVTEDHCDAKGASTGHDSCATRCVQEKGAKWALYVPEDKMLYVIVDQEEAARHNTKEVKVMATLDKEKKTARITEWSSQ